MLLVQVDEKTNFKTSEIMFHPAFTCRFYSLKLFEGVFLLANIIIFNNCFWEIW